MTSPRGRARWRRRVGRGATRWLVGLSWGVLAIVTVSAPAAAQPRDHGLAAGPGVERVAAVCTACHRASLIPRSMGYDRAGWDALTGAMIDLSGDPPAKTAILDYLAAHYPPDNPRPATLVEGPLAVRFTSWTAPTRGQRPRDPVEAPDGRIWWVGQRRDILGVLDPDTGALREYPLPPGARPHSVNIAPDGGVWYLGNGDATLGHLDPATGGVRTLAMPDPDARDPHTGVFDADGIFWFTLQHSNMIGRFDPATQDVRLAPMPTPNARPYGITVATDGTLWVACNGANCLVRVDPETMAATRIDLPGEDAHVRRLDIAEDGMIWYGDAGRGRLGRYDPTTGDITTWPSPSGPSSHPYALAIVDGIVWYTESGVRPDALVRFDPKTESFQSWAIPSGVLPSGPLYAGIVRHMRATRDGALLMHQGATNQIVRVAVPAAD